MGAAAKDLDVMVFGATGVTGREVARYLAEVGANWGAAGRDPAKLTRTLADVGAAPTATVAAEVGDRAALVEMASRATVVLNLVGPYTTRGRPVIEACIEAGAHYADLTGEIPFVREIVADLGRRRQRRRGEDRAGLRVRGPASRPRRAAAGLGGAATAGTPSSPRSMSRSPSPAGHPGCRGPRT